MAAEVALHSPFLLADARVDSNGRELALPEELVELGSTDRALDKDDDLVELQVVKKLVELPVLLTLFQLDVVLLETVKSQLGVLVDIMLGRVLHELPTDRLDLVRQCRTEHHDLLLLRSCTEDVLDIAPHVWQSQLVSEFLGKLGKGNTHQSDQASCRTRRGRRS